MALALRTLAGVELVLESTGYGVWEGEEFEDVVQTTLTFKSDEVEVLPRCLIDDYRFLTRSATNTSGGVYHSKKNAHHSSYHRFR